MYFVKRFCVCVYLFFYILINIINNNYYRYTVATTISTICGNYFTQHIPLHIPRRSLNKPKPIPDYLPD